MSVKSDAKWAERFNARTSALYRTSTLQAIDSDRAGMPLQRAIDVLLREGTPAALRVLGIANQRLRAYKKEYERNHPALGSLETQLAGDLNLPDFTTWCPNGNDVVAHYKRPRRENIDQGVLWGPTTWSSWDADDLTTHVETVVVLKLPDFNDDRRIEFLNPAYWSKKNPEYFRVSDPVHEDNGRLRRLPVQHGPWRGLLYEDFQMAWHGLSVTGFRNLLSIDFELPTTTYKLDRSMASSLWGVARTGGMEVNFGITTIQPCEEWLKNNCGRIAHEPLCNELCPYANDGDTFIARATKNVRFINITPKMASGSPLRTGDYMNYMAPAVLSTWMDLSMRGWIETLGVEAEW